ncbi:Replicase polyprotein 1a [Acromyrmex echinatior]|uniref:Replicase polyprotein 1a n=1 Tax=Acromyrmex echinatior TaxID=103372 RepID=F4WU18_ACREC|nr:Replicase polyprotein 1a [Acromyrmex echinatior]
MYPPRREDYSSSPIPLQRAICRDRGELGSETRSIILDHAYWIAAAHSASPDHPRAILGHSRDFHSSGERSTHAPRNLEKLKRNLCTYGIYQSPSGAEAAVLRSSYGVACVFLRHDDASRMQMQQTLEDEDDNDDEDDDDEDDDDEDDEDEDEDDDDEDEDDDDDDDDDEAVDDDDEDHVSIEWLSAIDSRSVDPGSIPFAPTYAIVHIKKSKMTSSGDYEFFDHQHRLDSVKLNHPAPNDKPIAEINVDDDLRATFDLSELFECGL